MAGTLIVNDTADWLPPGWLYDNALKKIAAELPPTETALLALLAKADTTMTSYADLRKLDARTFRALVAAGEPARARLVAAGAASFHQPDAFPGYMRWFDELLAKLKADPRAS